MLVLPDAPVTRLRAAPVGVPAVARPAVGAFFGAAARGVVAFPAVVVFFGLVFPALLLVVIGTVFPGATDPSPDFGGRSLVEIYAPVSIALGLATVALSLLPATLASAEGDAERVLRVRVYAGADYRDFQVRGDAFATLDRALP